MKINVQSIKFDADQKLLDFIDKKVGRKSFLTTSSAVMSPSLSSPITARP